MQQREFIEKTNELAASNTPFLFIVDFEVEKPVVCELCEANAFGFTYYLNGITNARLKHIKNQSIGNLTVDPVPEDRYAKAFHLAKQHILKGNSYLLNLTFPSKIRLDTGLKEIFFKAHAPYKLLYENFVLFSPECFIKIKEDNIYSYPMKGTIDAGLPDAGKIILQNEKESREHNTIVDLIRNDLSMIAEKVHVTNFRYITKIKTHKNELLQVSSEITGKLPPNWKHNFGNLLLKLLPAGSVSGAPKQKTLEIIRKAEGQKRGYYTGVFGIYDGKNVDSAVMIRYIEKTPDGYLYRSGGGITALSMVGEEYNELIEKIYVPIV